MSPADFVRAECQNVQDTLDETLRHEYGLKSRNDYYTECSFRLKVLQERLKGVRDSDHQSLARIATSLSELSRIISRIERSHLGEFSWPFADELERLVDPLCREDPNDPDTAPILHILSEGGLSAYAFYPEAGKRALTPRRRIINIVFPRTLKHYVLYHSLLGHEVGHAVGRIERHEQQLRKKVPNILRARGPLKNLATASAWIKSESASDEVAFLRNYYKIAHPERMEMNDKRLAGWLEEFMCDLFGLLMIGPAYLLAHYTMLPIFSTHASAWGEGHPPYACRAYLLSRAWELLKWRAPEPVNRIETLTGVHLL